MPIYDYQCTSCGVKKEVMRKVSEPNVTACPACGQETFAKMVSAPMPPIAPAMLMLK